MPKIWFLSVNLFFVSRLNLTAMAFEQWNKLNIVVKSNFLLKKFKSTIRLFQNLEKWLVFMYWITFLNKLLFNANSCYAFCRPNNNPSYLLVIFLIVWNIFISILTFMFPIKILNLVKVLSNKNLFMYFCLVWLINIMILAYSHNFLIKDYFFGMS